MGGSTNGGIGTVESNQPATLKHILINQVRKCLKAAVYSSNAMIRIGISY